MFTSSPNTVYKEIWIELNRSHNRYMEFNAVNCKKKN